MDMDFATSCPLVRPGLPRIRLLFEGSRFRSTLPSDGPSRFRPCASLVLHLHQVAQGTFTPRLPDMPGTQDAAPLPAGIDGHFGPDLRRFVLMHYHQGQSTLPRLTALLQSLGVSISKRQVQRLLTDKQDDFGRGSDEGHTRSRVDAG